MIALSIALGAVGLLAVIAAWHVALRVVARRDAIETLRSDVNIYQAHVDKELEAQVVVMTKAFDAFNERLETAEARAADLGAVARDMKNARTLGGKR